MRKAVRKLQAVSDLESAMIRLAGARGGISRVELARKMKLVPSTTGIYVDRLLAEGYLQETAVAVRGLGRPPVVLQLNPLAGQFVGVDFDARQVCATAVDFAQQPLGQVRRTIPARATVERVLEVITDTINHVAAAAQHKLLGIGLGVPGPVDTERGISLRYAFLPEWQDVPIGPRMAEHFHVPVSVENNLRSIALAELWAGQGRGLRNFVCLGVRSGIGSGIIINGQLLRGAHNLAGEIGRWACPSEFNEEGSSSSPTIEDLASLDALLKESTIATVADLLTALDQRQRTVVSLVRRAARVHAWVVHQLATLFDPERIIVAGPLAEQDVYLSALQGGVADFGGAALAAILTPSLLGPFAGASGGAALAFQQWKPER
ncbi:MAG TPA: ROK family protein [Pirellulales bacterium]|nr:ROK family protein [Pirellulales bacterium]